MSILIKGVKMPKGCLACPFMSFGGNGCTMWCQWLDEPLGEWSSRGGNWRHPACPLVEVPTPHGRLIDADALKVSLAFAEKTAEWAVPALRAVLIVIDEMPTIIEVEEE